MKNKSATVSFKRGALAILSLYSLAFVSIPLVLTLLGDGAVNFPSPWFHVVSLIVFIVSWAGLWEDMGAVAERDKESK